MAGSVSRSDQETQLWFSDTYNDGLAAGQPTLETASTDGQYDFNALRSQVSRIWDATMGSSWFDDAPTVNSKKRAILQLNTNLDTVEIKPFLFPDIILPDITVPAAVDGTGDSIGGVAPTMTLTDAAALFTVDMIGRTVTIAGATTPANNGTFPIVGYTGPTIISYTNAAGVVEAFAGTWDVSDGDFVVLSVAGSEAPTQTAAVGAVTTEGAVVAFEVGFPIGSITEVAGPNALSPLNLCLIRKASTGEPIISAAGKEIYGLLQCEDAVDGHTFDDVNKRVQISFVEENAAGDNLILVPPEYIGGEVINYQYVRRLEYLNLPEWAFLFRVFEDQVGGTDVTRQRAYTNQAAAPVNSVTNSTLDLEGPGLYWELRDDLEARLFGIIEGSAGGTSEVQIATDVDTFNVDAQVNDFAKGVTIDSTGNDIAVGVTAGHVETTGAAVDLHLQGGREIFLDDTNQTGSGWVQTDGIKLSETQQEWIDFKTAFGEVSLLNAIEQAKSATSRCKTYAAVLAADIVAGTLIEGPGGPGAANTTADLCDYRTSSWVTQVDMYVNGKWQWNGVNLAAAKDNYPSAVAVEMQFGCYYQTFPLKWRGGGGNEDVISMVAWG